MVNMTLKQKILLLTLIPLIAMLGAVMVLVNMELRKTGQHEIELLSRTLIDSKKDALRDYVEIAVTAVKHIHDNAQPGDTDAEERALAILTNLSFGEKGDGYIFVYKYDGTNLATRPKPQLKGKNLINLQDKTGVYIVRELIDIARKGGGFLKYVWAKPSKNNAEVDKLSYAVTLPKWEWMVGTGFYIDDVDDVLAEAERKLEEDINASMIYLLMIGAGFVIVFGFISYLFANGIANPLAAAAAALRDIGEGEGDLSKRLDECQR
jgi:methyl-accepting chemotaxis protein